MKAPLLRGPRRETARGGGVPARRAVARWAWRLFRREWRQQILVLALLTLAVAAATFSAAFAYNVTRGPEGQYGSAEHRIVFTNSDPASTAADLAAAEDYFDTVDVVGSRFVRAPGSVENVEVRAQDPEGAFSAPMLAIREGRYPTGADEVAVTDSVAQTFEIGVGDSLALESQSRGVVGVVENPNDLDDEFALVARSHAGTPEEVTILVGGGRDRVEIFRERMTTEGNVFRASRHNDKAWAVVGTFSLVTVGMLLVALIAAAGFVVLAQRRMRQLGVLAAVGATDRHVRLVTLANGVLVGAVAAVIGTAIGLVVWAWALARVEEAAAHRIDGLNVPLLLIAASMLLAIVTATAASWWPARAIARIPITLALSARPPRPKPAHRTAVFAGILIAIGLVSFDLADQKSIPLTIVGTIAVPLGFLLIAPLAIRALAAFAPRVPIAGRIALRDLARYQARSGAALAAISLALGIAVSVVAVATAAERADDEGNLSDRQFLIRIGNWAETLAIPKRTQAQIESMNAEVHRLAAALDEPLVLDLDMAVNPDMPPEPGVGEPGAQIPVELVRRRSDGQFDGFHLYLATPQLITRFAGDSSSIDSNDVVTAKRGNFVFFGPGRKDTPVTNVGSIDGPGYSSLPHSFITPASVRSNGWERVRAGWFIETDQPLTSDEIGAARDMAAAAGLTIEARDDQSSLSNLRFGATGAGGLLAVGILAMTVGLIRGEGAADLRTLTATGATSRIRRWITATTAAALAFLGAVLGTTGAYLSLIAGDVSGVGRVPVFQLAVIVLGVPLVAAVCGWLLAGREPPFVARAALE